MDTAEKSFPCAKTSERIKRDNNEQRHNMISVLALQFNTKITIYT